MQLQQNTDDPLVWHAQLAPSEGAEQIVLSEEGLLQLQAWLQQARTSETCRVLVLEGSDGAFCEGMDLTWITSADPTSESDDSMRAMRIFAETLEALATAPQAVLVCVDGAVRAGGMGLAAAADVLIATERSQFGLPEVMLGLVPSMVLPLLQARVGFQKAQRWTMMAESFNALEAQSMGFVDICVTDEKALQKAVKQSIRQLLRMHPEAVAACKRFCQDIQTMSLSDALQHGAQTTGSILQQPERLAGIRSFLEGEPLPWFARYRPKRETQ